MSKQLKIVVMTIAFVGFLAVGVWAGVRYSGGSFFSCTPGTDLNGDGSPDCSYVAQFLWVGGSPGTTAADADLVVTQATLLCDNNGTAFKVTFGKGTRLLVAPSTSSIGQTDGQGQFTTFSSFPNRVEDFASLADFRDFWFGDNENHCRNKTQTEVAIFISALQVQGRTGSQCTSGNDVDSCQNIAESPILTCSTNNPFGNPPVVFACQ